MKKSISVVIPNYKKNPLLKHLPNIINACPNCQIIVVDDASPDDTVKVLRKKFKKVKVIKNKTNQRFAKSCNIGVKAASGDIVILLNSDVSPKKGFLKPLLKNFNDPKVFAVGCLEINPNNQVSGRNQCQFKRGFLVHAAKKITNRKKTTTNCWASGGSMALDRQKYLKIGGMDVLYKPAYWEDIDLSWRAREIHGLKILFEPKSVVFHHHETTNINIFGLKKMEIMSMRNQFLFVWKNIKGLKLLQHFLWLPYHFIFTNLRTKGIFTIAFLQAVIHWVKYKT